MKRCAWIVTLAGLLSVPTVAQTPQNLLGPPAWVQACQGDVLALTLVVQWAETGTIGRWRGKAVEIAIREALPALEELRR